MPDGMISIALYVERSSESESGGRTINGSVIYPINNTNATTTINAMDGETVIFAGLITEKKTSINVSVPVLNKIPLIKHLFENDFQSCNRNELLIVMTPRIIRTQADLDLLNQQERERMHWCAMDVIKLTGNSGMRRRSDEWTPTEVRHTYGSPTQLSPQQLPPAPIFPLIETK
jgi:type II secretory pathway component GspD/PulD (secretin)